MTKEQIDSHLIFYGDSKFKKICKRLKKEAKNTGWFKSIVSYHSDDLSPEFCENFKNILSHQRGGGYWIWKWDIILNRLEKIPEGDIIIYLDSGCSINRLGHKRYVEYLEMVKKSTTKILSFQMPHIEKNWTTMEVFNICKNKYNVDESVIEKVKNTGQYVGGILIMENNSIIKKLFRDCISIVQKDNNIITDYYNKIQHEYFRDHRHDQSILSVVRKIYGSEVIPNDETYFIPFGNVESWKYPFWATRCDRKRKNRNIVK